jgi:hypothetical protein
MNLLLGKEVKCLGEKVEEISGPHALEVLSTGELRRSFCFGAWEAVITVTTSSKKGPMEGEKRAPNN